MNYQIGWWHGDKWIVQKRDKLYIYSPDHLLIWAEGKYAKVHAWRCNTYLLHRYEMRGLTQYREYEPEQIELFDMRTLPSEFRKIAFPLEK